MNVKKSLPLSIYVRTQAPATSPPANSLKIRGAHQPKDIDGNF